MQKIVNSKLIYKGKILELYLNKVLLQDGTIVNREIIKHKSAVAIIALDDDFIYLVKQFRNGIDDFTLEIPAGLLEDNEQPQEAAIRELQEEIGYYPNSLTHLFSLPTSPGFCTEIVHFFLAKDLEFLPLKPDDDEFIEITKVKLSSIDQDFISTVNDMKTVLSLLYLKSIK